MTEHNPSLCKCDCNSCDNMTSDWKAYLPYNQKDKEEFEADWLIAYRVAVNAWLDMFGQSIQFQKDIFNFFLKEKADLEQIYAHMFPPIVNSMLQNGYFKSMLK